MPALDWHAMGALRDFQIAFTSYIRDPERAQAPSAVPLDRMQLYARLVYGNVERVMGNMFPVLKQATPEPLWNALVRSFFRDHPMHDPLFQSMPQEFVRYLERRTAQEGDPPWLLELAHYEWVDYALSVDETDIDMNGVDRDGDIIEGVPVLNPLIWMLSYSWPVHRLRDQAAPAEAPADPSYLVAYRDLEDRVGYLELTPVTARLLELADTHRHACGRELLASIATEIGQAQDEAFFAQGREIIQQLRARSIVLGAARIRN